MHKHADFSLEFVKKALANVSDYEVVHECPLVDIYSWELVCKKPGVGLRREAKLATGKSTEQRRLQTAMP